MYVYKKNTKQTKDKESKFNQYATNIILTKNQLPIYFLNENHFRGCFKKNWAEHDLWALWENT